MTGVGYVMMYMWVGTWDKIRKRRLGTHVWLVVMMRVVIALNAIQLHTCSFLVFRISEFDNEWPVGSFDCDLSVHVGDGGYGRGAFRVFDEGTSFLQAFVGSNHKYTSYITKGGK